MASINQARTQYPIQYLRGLAASLVVFHHTAFQVVSARTDPFVLREHPAIWEFGAAGVDIFFVISGFIIFYTMGAATGVRAAGLHLWHRFTRVVPLYWFWTTILLGAMTAGLALANTRLTFGWIVASYALIPFERAPGQVHPVLDQGWTLSFELYFYAVAAVMILFLPLRRRLLGLAVAMVALQALTLAAVETFAFRQWLGSSLIYEFLAGAAIAWWVRFGQTRPMVRQPIPAVVLTIVGLTWLAATIAFPFDGAPRFVTWGVPSIFLVLAAVISNRPSSNRIEHALFQLGTASYSLYLTHTLATVTLGGLLKRGFLSSIDPTLITIVATLIIIVGGSLSYWIVEKPILAVFRRKRQPPFTEHLGPTEAVSKP
ncbi:acyltransferase [Aureimonas sp. AU4]|uniref:acyltransferase family protein n=1 Tax=Aureimonas sp. AU4 TaxID=1638163 RepID=UPI000705B6B8|nr:acyltransferase [Aureimonas sp. AU4]BAT30764.1 acyltransferase 3 [Aureimonas sp. AU4]